MVVFQNYEANEEVPIRTEVVLQVSNGSLVNNGDANNNNNDNEPDEGAGDSENSN